MQLVNFDKYFDYNRNMIIFSPFLIKNLSVDFVEFDLKSGKLLNVVGKPLWFWAE